ncbi:MAG: GNAT family N-acetyltransferase [Bacteroidetes bacterium]|nr:GNAT family N-acetyltransferase [Bacteroidota bacterium]
MTNAIQSQYLQIKETERLYLRPLQMADIEDWQAFCKDSIATQYFPSEFTANPNMAKDWVEKQLARYRDGTFGMLALIEKETGAYVGQCGLLTRLEFEPNELEVGYSLIREFWGKGYASEAAQYLRDYAFKHNLKHEITSMINPENKPSINVALKNGMTDTGLVDFFGMKHHRFCITRDEWEKNKAETK